MGGGRTLGGWGVSRVAPSAVEGLLWLVRVGPAPLPALATALGWSERLGWRWSRQLIDAGWVRRVPTIHREASLLVATAAGVQMTGVAVRVPRAPAPTWWAHLTGCAWTAAWLTARGRPMQGPREVDVDASWEGRVQWRDRRGRCSAGHRPDLAWVPEEGRRVAVEVELARKSTPRLEAILALHASWRETGASDGVIYVCGHPGARSRVIELAAGQGLSLELGGGLRVELLADITAQATAAGEALRIRRRAASPSAGERRSRDASRARRAGSGNLSPAETQLNVP